MSRNLIKFSFLALASLSKAAPNVCPQASAIATALSKASISVTPFCSSFLGIPTRTSTLTLTSTPSPITLDSTSTVLSLTTASTTITSTVTTATVTVTTATSYSIDGSNKKRALATGQRIPNPVESDGLNKRATKMTTTTSKTPTSTAKIPPCLTAFASSIISSGCACLNIPTPTQTTTVSTTLPGSTVTRTSTTTVITTTTTTQEVDQTATATATSTAVVDVCNASNNYGVIYSGGYAADSSDQSNVGAISQVVPDANTQQACCAACYNTTACFVYYLNGGSCNLLLTQGGSSTQATAQCPQGRLDEFPSSDDPASGFFGIGACARFVAFSS